MKKYQQLLLADVDKFGSQRQVAIKLGIPMTSFYGYTMEDKLPRLDTLLRLADIWDVPVGTLMNEVNAEGDITDAIIHELRKLAIDDKHNLLQKLKGGTWR